MTHNHEHGHTACVAFMEIIKPFVYADKLGCILAQFPYSFYFNSLNWEYLKLFRHWLADLPLVVEFRNAQDTVVLKRCMGYNKSL